MIAKSPTAGAHAAPWPMAVRIDDAQAQAARDVRVLALVVALLAGGWALASALWLYPGDWRRLALTLLALVGSLGALRIAARSPAKGAWLLLATAWLAVTGSVLSAAAFPSPILTGYFALIAVAMRLFGTTGGIVLASSTLLALCAGLLLPGHPVRVGSFHYERTEVLLIQLVFLAATMAAFPVTSLRRSSARSSARPVVRAAPRDADCPTARELALVDRAHAQRLLAVGVAHELENVLSTIVATCDLAVADGARPKEATQFRAVADTAHRAGRLSARLVSFGGEVDSWEQSSHVAALVSTTAELVQHVLPARHRIRVQLEPGLPPIRVVPSEIEYALLNLLVDAREAMPSGGEIRLRAERLEGEGNRSEAGVQISVSDTGERVRPEMIQEIDAGSFASWESARAAGLGLAVVQSIAARHGGRLEVASEPGRGRMLRLLLPQRS